MIFEPTTYFEQIARDLKAVGHTDDKQKYFVVPGTMSFFQFFGNNEFLNAIRTLNLNDIVMVYQDDRTGRVYGPNEDQTLRLNNGHLFILKNLNQNDFQSEIEWMKESEDLLKQVMAKLKLDEENDMFDCTAIKIHNNSFMEIRKVLDTWFGMGISFSWDSNYSLVYDASKWL